MKLVLVTLLINICSFASAQYADQGTSTLKNKIWWFDWNGFSITDGASRTFTTDDGLVVNVTFSKVSGTTLYPSVMDTWSGALLYYLYNFSNTSVEPAFYYSAYQDWTSNFSINITATRNGVPTPFSFVAADAEASAAGEEFTTLNTSGSVWNTIDFFRNSQQTDNPLTGCGTNSVTIVDTYGNQVGIGQNPVLETDAPATGLLNVDIALKEQGPQGGGMGLAFGIFAPVDRGDLPPSYGFAYHKIIYSAENSCNYNPPYPTLTQSQALKIGSVAPDADPVQYTDDNAHELADEEGVSSLPVYNGSGAYSVDVVVSNTTGSDAFLTGWFDYNRDGTFNANESVTVTIPNNATNATLKWVGLPATLPTGTVTNYGFRFRLSSDKAATQNAIGFAKDGEVEDYLDTIIPPSVTPAFTIPDTVCVNSAVTIKNTTAGASTYYWSFCTADITQPPTGTNLGNVSNVLNTPVFIDYATQNGNYYAFATNFQTGELVRLDFGASMLNTPTATDLGSFGGILPYATTEGIQVVQNNGNWYALIVGGTPENGTSPKIVKIAFGTSLTNPSPVATDWGNIGNLDLPHDLYVFQQGSNWYGFTINKNNNTVTRFDFGSSFENVPTGTNLGTFAGFNLPTGIFASNDNGQWHVFVVNSYDGPNPDITAGTITRIDFGTSLLNPTPTSINLGNIGGAFHNPRDIYIIKYCGANVGFVVNHATNDIVRLDFPGDLTTTPTALSLGNIGNLDFPHSISKLFRVGADIYALIPNAASSTITRIKFSGCNSSSTPSSTAENPPSVTYSTPGVYNINLAIDDGLATQNSLCQQVVVLGPPTIEISNDTTICSGDSVQLMASGAASYQWSPAATLSNPNISNPVAKPLDSTMYFVTAKNSAGCAAKDSVTIKILQHPVIKTIPDTSICSGTTIQLSTIVVNGSTYSWLPVTALSNPSVASPLASPTISTQYIITVNPGSQCAAKDTVNITVNPSPLLSVSADTAICAGSTVQLTASSPGNPAYSWFPAGSLTSTSTNNPVASPVATTTYYVQVTGSNNCKSVDSVTIMVTPVPAITTLSDTTIILCKNSTIQLITTTVNANTYSWSPATGLSDANVLSPYATPLVDTKYTIKASNGNCFAIDSVSITVKPSPSVTAAGDTVICSGSTVQLSSNASPGVTYSWLPVTGLSNPLSPNPSATPLSSTVYVVQVMYADGCTAQDSVNITVHPQPTVKSIPDTAICSGTTIQLATTATNGSSYNWSPATGLSNATLLSPSANPQASEQYIITVNPGSLCTAMDTVNITVNPLPLVTTSGDTLICTGGAGQLLASSPTNVTYSWLPVTGLSSPSVPNPVATPSSTTSYNVTVTDNNFCSASSTVVVTVNPQPVFGISPSTASICIGDTVTVTAFGGDIYSWNPISGVMDPTAPSTVLSPPSTTNYQVFITNSTCKVTDTVQALITVTTKPDVTISKSNDLDCFVGQATLEATGGDSYTWSPATSLNNPYSASPVASPFATTTYYVQVSKGAGCVAQDSIQLKVLTNEQNGYKVPTAFTPNGDGFNDCFGVKLWGGIKSIDFSVYNRWGQRIFHTNNPNDCWDGTFNGQQQPPGAFVYQIQANTTCGAVYRKGTVVLVR